VVNCEHPQKFLIAELHRLGPNPLLSPPDGTVVDGEIVALKLIRSHTGSYVVGISFTIRKIYLLRAAEWTI
jgi:hypothetical protein